MKHIMKVGLILIIVATVIIVGVGATAALAAPPFSQVQGTIAGKTADTVTIAPKDGGDDVVLKVNGSTQITKAGIGKATLGDLLVNDRVVATYTVSGDIKTASKLTVTQPLAKNHGFVGNITIVSSTSIKITTKKQGDVPITVNGDTKFNVPGVKDATLANFDNGDRVAVLAVEGTSGDYVALHVNLIPGKPESVQHVGTVTYYIANTTITIKDKKNVSFEFKVTTDTKILFKRGATDGESIIGKQATVIASRDLATDVYTARAILVFGPKGKP